MSAYITRQLPPNLPAMKRASENTNAQLTKYLFTYNNWTEDGRLALHNWLLDTCKYACYQPEIGLETGTPHLQGYFSLKKGKRMTTIHNLLHGLGVSLILLEAKGTAEENKKYCSKATSRAPGGVFTEIGSLKCVGQGTRTDLQSVTDAVVAQKPLIEIATEHPQVYLRYGKGIRDLHFILARSPKERPMETTVIYGHSGTGKSHKARQLAALYGEYYEVEMPNGGNQWWDGYNGEKSIIIDEFNGWIKPVVLNKIMDKYRFKLPTKGSTIYAHYEHVFITSNYEPDQWWHADVKWDRTALFRRITNLYEYRGTTPEDSERIKLK